MVSDKKKNSVVKLAAEIEKWPVIGLLDLAKLPAAQLQQIRAALRGKAEIKMTKKSTIRFAAEKTKKNIKGLLEFEANEPAIILSDIEPFVLYKSIIQNRTDAFAKAGDVAPFDIIIPAGKTSLPPGPVISELQKEGIKAAIKGPSIEILESKTITKEGQQISAPIAGILQKLNIKPMQLQLNILATFAEGTIYSKDILAIVEEDWGNQIVVAWRAAFNLAYNSNWPTAATMPLKISEAVRNALNLAINAEIYTKETIEVFLAKANAQAASLKSLLPS